ncbi:NADP-dependent oxidoreductase domain-containing protein [Bisporella sp. PMI_857]|nr:NADP-dependent oxidoreductase domain-containing protein [Bisporella sp. PMI_857]
MSFPPPAPAKRPLGTYQMLAPNASVRVSQLCLGGMNFGNAWAGFMGECDQKTSEQILDYFYDAGGNFIDTSNNYQNEESEKWIGEWMKKRGNRNEIVVATKFTTCYRAGKGDKEIVINTAGNGTKSLHVSLEKSLERLQTNYIDLLYVHWLDFTCSIPELMQSLNTVVLQKIAKQKNTLTTSVALAYVRQKSPYVFPIVGGRKIEHLKSNIEALSLALSEKEMDEIEGSHPFDIGFPQNFLGGPKGVKSPMDVWLMSMAGHQEHVPWPTAIGANRK